MQFIGLRLEEPTPCRAYASERIIIFFVVIHLVSRIPIGAKPIACFEPITAMEAYQSGNIARRVVKRKNLCRLFK